VKRPSSRKPKESSNPYPYRQSRVRIPRQVKSAADLWLDFFQQFCEQIIDTESLKMVIDQERKDRESIGRARILADYALTAFQERFPGVHP
jgi:hypothetical protein